jgi:crotonobetainyl-CoA:carnitine CoA-transferase CaiB-like acyl-CoA transferase
LEAGCGGCFKRVECLIDPRRHHDDRSDLPSLIFPPLRKILRLGPADPANAAARARTGEGQRIDVALMDCMLNLLVYELQEAQFPIRAPRPTYGPVRARDGDLLIAPVTARNFTSLCEVTGQCELANDPRFTSVPTRGANWTAMMQVVEKWTERHTVDECIAALDTAGVPCARFRDPGAALTDPHLIERGAFAKLTDGAGDLLGVNAPWKMSGAQTSMRSEIPAIGAHRDEVLSSALGSQPG